MNTKWKLVQHDEQQLNYLRDHYSLAEPLLRILARTPSQDLSKFFEPDIKNLQSPFDLPNMHKACSRILQSFNTSDSIVVFGDYDVDGITASSVMYKGLKSLGYNVVVFVPDRLTQGYGFERKAVEACLELYHPKLIITVDCGTNSVAMAEYVQSLGVDLIISDHHEPDERVANALATVNPKLTTTGMLGYLAGVGVAYYICRGICVLGKEQGLNLHPEMMDFLLDLVAIGTVADMVPLVEDNRILVHVGLTRMQTTHHVGLKQLLKQVGGGKTLTSQDIGFKIGPRINAAGRLGDARLALTLFLTDNEVVARDTVLSLEVINEKRKTLTKEALGDILQRVNATFDPAKQYSIVVVGTEYHAGIVGIVAANIMKKFNRPTIVLTVSRNGTASGSCRSIPLFNIHEGLEHCKDLLNHFGGHSFACGLNIPVENIDAFRARFEAFSRDKLEHHDLTPVLDIDAVLEPKYLNWGFYNQQQLFAPYGKDHVEPLWVIYQASIRKAFLLGKKHLKVVIDAPLMKEGCIEGILFNYTGKLPKDTVDMVFKLGTNTFNGNTSLQCVIEDIRLNGD